MKLGTHQDMSRDVVCDFSEVKIIEIGKNLVRVENAKGIPPTNTL